ncbi:nitrous oxide reductase accessory protein NosL [Actibacterium sp. MT2.3-13A]|uniref:nitrous oxide reductase accessory protein NosL n=1 Tax=Actibacterium sp. MT2.3-13A TaxID=2828332 RepID=UPI001BA61D5C|nr:nitrous oxide reductase accessory protein NosL [Actibacterium sp. MT2.3-13A]
MKKLVLALTLGLSLAACKEDTAGIPAPVAMTSEALGHYCQMFVADHPGPKAQIHLKGYAAPLWFSQVTDAVAYVSDPERPAEITAIYVSDMGAAESWTIPGENNWLAAGDAHFVIESGQPGGMGLPEAIPFAEAAAAQAFTDRNGGRVVRFDEVPEAYARPDMEVMAGQPTHGGTH